MESTRTDAQRDLADSVWSNTPAFGLAGRSFWARVVDVYDGDTLTVAVTGLLQGVEPAPQSSASHRVTLRLRGIDAPEMRSTDPSERDMAVQARDRLVEWLMQDASADMPPRRGTRTAVRRALERRVVVVWVACGATEKYGRTLADVSLEPGGTVVSRALLAEGLVASWVPCAPLAG